jgi:hypothetical protein
MIMRPKYRVYLMDIIRNKLLSQIGGRIDQQPRSSIIFNNDRGPRTSIARFLRVAIAPVQTKFTADARNTGRGSAAR